MAQNGIPLWQQFISGVQPVGAKMDSRGNVPSSPFNSVVTSTPQEAADQKGQYDNPIPVLFPRYLAAPEGAETVDMRRIAVLNPGETFSLFSFTCPPGCTTVLYNYALFTDALNNADVSWLPTLDGRRILAYHGDPADNFKINLAVAVDLGAAALIPCQVFMQPNQVLSWQVTNTGLAQISMGVRMNGYLDVGQRLTASKIGG